MTRLLILLSILGSVAFASEPGYGWVQLAGGAVLLASLGGLVLETRRLRRPRLTDAELARIVRERLS